ncbi:MAG TPA: hypothetical protein VFH85_04875 [Gammaproteobacteria bacterium]|nr:hypothetical protein [Gammaproteobacteria bacterium]
MNRYVSRSDQADRLRIAREAARILAEEGVRDFLLAKRKATERLGLDARNRRLPTNREIEEALAEHHRLFNAAAHERRLRELREAASRAMRIFANFEPRLVGGVLSGLAAEHAPVQLHLFADAAEQVAIHLLDRGLKYELDERRLKQPRGGAGQSYPMYRFALRDVVIEATVFPHDAIRQAPASPVDGRPMRRAGLDEVEALLETG